MIRRGGWGFWGLGFWVLGFWGLGFRVWGLEVLASIAKNKEAQRLVLLDIQASLFGWLAYSPEALNPLLPAPTTSTPKP